MELRRTDHDKAMVLLVFRSTELHRLLTERHPDASFFNVLHPDPRRLLAVPGPGRRPGAVVLPTPPVEAARSGTPEAAACERLVRAAVGAHVDVAFDYIGVWDPAFRQRSPLPAAGGCSWLETPRTAIRPTAATASTPVSRMPATSAGNWPRPFGAGRAKACSTPTTPSGAACSSRPRQTSSRPSSSGTAALCSPSIPKPTGRRSSGPGRPGKSATTAWPPSSPTTRDRPWSWARPAACQAPEGRTASRPVPVITCRPVLSVPRPQRQPDR